MGGRKSAGKLCIALIAAAVSLSAALSAEALQQEFSSSMNPIGSGARATGMGGAFIAVADDATAASWNPAGLVQLEKPEFSFVLSDFMTDSKYHSSALPDLNGADSVAATGLNYGSIAYPFVLFKRNMIVSLNYQRLFDMNKNENLSFTGPALNLGGGITSTGHNNISFEQRGYLSTISPAAAIQIAPSLFVGATLNLWQDIFHDNGWKKINSNRVVNVFSGAFHLSNDTNITLNRDVAYKGVNYQFGALWNFYGPFTLGAVYKTSFDARLKIKTNTNTEQCIYAGDAPGQFDPACTGGIKNPDFSNAYTEYATLVMPASYGLGLQYRHSDAWTVAVDVFRTEWSRFVRKDPDGIERNPIDDTPVSQGRLKDTTQVRLGTEYLFIREKSVIPIRFGLFYDPEPKTGGLDDYYGFSCGTGYAAGKVAFDVSYQYRVGTNVASDLRSSVNGSADIRQHTVMFSVIFHF